jgi:hypothetical protein
MRTLLNECLPPCAEEQTLSQPEPAIPPPRNFSQNAVLDNLDDLTEVGLAETVRATPSAGAEPAKPALARGIAIPQTAEAPSAPGV